MKQLQQRRREGRRGGSRSYASSFITFCRAPIGTGRPWQGSARYTGADSCVASRCSHFGGIRESLDSIPQDTSHQLGSLPSVTTGPGPLTHLGGPTSEHGDGLLPERSLARCRRSGDPRATPRRSSPLAAVKVPEAAAGITNGRHVCGLDELGADPSAIKQHQLGGPIFKKIASR